jgi:hypothetical protein
MPDFSFKQWFSARILVFFAVPVLAFAAVMWWRTIPYMAFEHASGFLGTKTDEVLAKPVYLPGFYVHITSSILVLMSGVWQFVPAMIRRWPVWHRRLGKVYLVTILLLAAPSGLVLAWYANGGLSSRTGFMLQCVVWWVFTLLAWREAQQQRWKAHAEMMIRSFAITLAAMSLRTESYIMYYYWGTKPIETYQTVTWLSWVGNWVLAEWIIYLGAARWLLRGVFHNTIEHH